MQNPKARLAFALLVPALFALSISEAAAQKQSASAARAECFRQANEAAAVALRHRTIRSTGCLSNMTALAMVFNCLRPRRKTGVVSGHNQLPKLVLGATFNDGIEVIAKPADRQPITAAA